MSFNRRTKSVDMRHIEPMELAYRYLSMKEHTEKEVKDYLLDKGCTLEEAEDTVEELTHKNYIDNVGYAVRYIEYALSKDRGYRRIIQELYLKGIYGHELESAIFTYEEEHGISLKDQRERAMKIAKKALADGEPTKKNLDRIARKLKTLGYESEDIYHAISKDNFANRQ